jgi:hypothetical protein
MALSIGDRQKEELAALLIGNGRRDCGIQPSARQDDRSIIRWFHHIHPGLQRRVPSAVAEREPHLTREETG